MDEGATSRRVYLPPGRWLPFEEGAPVTGPADLEVSAPLSEIPLFGRAGGVVPLLPEGVDSVLLAAAPTVSLAAAENWRTILVFAGADGSFTERDDARRRAVVRLSGAGPLDLGGAELTISGGPTRALEVILRW